MTYLLLLVYLFLLAFLVKKWQGFRLSNINRNWIVAAAIAKMLAGVVYVFVHLSLIKGGDSMLYFKDGEIIFKELFQSPLNYVQLVFGACDRPIPPELREPIMAMGFWSDPAAYIVVRCNALFRLVSFGNIYIHGLLAGWFSFLGCFALAKSVQRYLSFHQIAVLSIFFFPSLLFWTSGLHKEFLSVFGIGWLIFALFELYYKYNIVRNLFIVVIASIVLWITRNYLFLLFFPTLASFLIANTVKVKPIIVYLSVFAVLFLLGAFVPLPLRNETAIQIIINKKDLFHALQVGNTSIELGAYNNLKGLLLKIPQSLFNTIIRPFGKDVNTVFLALASVESILILVLLAIAPFKWATLSRKEKNFACFFFVYGFSFLLIIGWIVPNIGAILRYRSIALLFLVPLAIELTLRLNIFKKYVAKN